MDYTHPVLVLLSGGGIAVLLALALNGLLKLGGLPKLAWVAAARRPLTVLVFAAVFLRAFSMALGDLPTTLLTDRWAKLANQSLALLWLALFVWAVVRFAESLFKIQQSQLTDPSDTQKALITKKFLIGAALVIGLMFAMRTVGIDTSPLLAGGAVGGVIIGLALQESLSNVFSGLLFTLDGAVRIGDLIRLGSGKEGYVRAVGWRSTQVKLHDETLLVVPNSVMSKEVIENLSRPSDSLIVSIEVAVQVGEKLTRVEEVCQSVLHEVQARFSHGKELREPWIRWRQIGDTGVVVRLFLPVASIEDQYHARSELLREVHDRFQAEHLAIPLPVRVVHPPAPSP